MKGDFHVRFRENLRVKLPWVTRLWLMFNMKIFKFILLGLVLIPTATFGQRGQLLYEGCICFDSSSVDQSLNWYALIKTERKFYYVLQPVKIAMNTNNDCELSPLEIKTNATSKSLFLIGTDLKWEKKEIFAPYNWDQSGGIDITKSAMNIYSIDLQDDKKSTSYTIYRFGSSESGGFGIIAKTSSGQEKAYEFQKSFDSEMLKRNRLIVSWFGDLDGDSTADLILGVMTDGEGGIFNFLFLSTQAGTNEIIGKTAETNIGYCN
jgi:hypothetical protein